MHQRGLTERSAVAFFCDTSYLQHVARLLFFILTCAGTLVASMAELGGEWVGTFNGQPDGSYQETQTKFELALKANGNTITGTFTNLGESPPKSQQIRDGGRFGKDFCFSVVISGEPCRWCIRANKTILDGVWNRGPEGGPMLGGLGVGARLFRIRANKVGTRGKRE
jgi:hypothetical protein